MFENKKCIGHAVGGAVVGVAVGMAIHKYLSPHSSQQPSAIAEIPSSRRACAHEKKRSRSEHLEIPKTHAESKNRRSCSKSPSEQSKCRQPKIHCSRMSSNSSDKLSSKSNLINLSSCSKNREKAKTEKTLKIVNDQSCEKSQKHLELSLNASTQYLPLKWKKDKNSFPNPAVSCNEKNKKSHLNNETNEKSTYSKPIEDQNNSEDSIFVKDSKYSNVYLKKNVTPGDENIESAIATCDTFDHRSSLDFVHDMSCFGDAKFRTLPIFNASSVVSSTEYFENV